MKTLLRSLAAVLLAGLLGAAAHAGPVLQLVPDRTKLHGTEDLQVDLVLSGLAPGMQLAGLDLSLKFDPFVLTLLDVTLGGALGDPDDEAQTVAIVFPDFWNGTATVVEVSLLEASAFGCVFCVGPYLDELQSAGPLVLATLLFQGTGAWSPSAYTSLQLTDLMLADAVGDPIGGVMVNNATIEIAEPAAAWLAAVALLAAFSTAVPVSRRRAVSARN